MIEAAQELLRSIPVKVRKTVYGVLGIVYLIESTLDAFDAGVIPERSQGIALAVLSALGFGMAVANTGTTPKP